MCLHRGLILGYVRRPVQVRQQAEDASNELTGIARLVLQRAHLHWIDLDLQMEWCEERIEAHARTDDRASRAAALQGRRW
jgi:hypothetical protein